MRRLGVPALIPALLTIPALALTLPASTAAQPEAAAGPNPFRDGWSETVVDADQNFRGLEAVSKREAWVTGESLTDDGPARVFRTTDRGQTWTDVSPDGTEGLSFRDVEVHGSVAHVLAIGPGEASRIYRSTDGGASWDESFRNTDEKAFYDCMAFYGKGRHGLAVSDPVDGKLRILATDDRGRSWSVLPDKGMPRSKDEFGFAASGDCLVTSGRSAFLITGGKKSRVMRSDDRGRTWTAVASGIPAGEAAGGFAGAFASPRGASRSAATSRRPTTPRTRRPTPATAGPGPRAATSPTSARTSPTCAARGTPSRPATTTGRSGRASPPTAGARGSARAGRATTPSTASARSAGPPAARAASATTECWLGSRCG